MAVDTGKIAAIWFDSCQFITPKLNMSLKSGI